MLDYSAVCFRHLERLIFGSRYPLVVGDALTEASTSGRGEFVLLPDDPEPAVLEAILREEPEDPQWIAESLRSAQLVGAFRRRHAGCELCLFAVGGMVDEYDRLAQEHLLPFRAREGRVPFAVEFEMSDDRGPDPVQKARATQLGLDQVMKRGPIPASPPPVAATKRGLFGRKGPAPPPPARDARPTPESIRNYEWSREWSGAVDLLALMDSTPLPKARW